MRIETIIIARSGLPPMRVLVIRVDGRRRARIARALVRAGYPRWQIRSLLRLYAKGLNRVFSARDAASFWGASIAAQIASELREAA